MARRDRDFRILLINILDGLRELYSSSEDNTYQLIESVNFLEDILSPYMNQDKGTTYKPRTGSNEMETLHYRIRECMRVAKAVALMPPKEIVEDAREFTAPDVD